MFDDNEENRVRQYNKVFHAEQSVLYDETHDYDEIAADLFRMSVSETDRVLDVGTGTGFVREILPTDDIIGIDLSRPMLEEGSENESMLIEAVAGYIPLKDKSIDMISGRSVLHHLPNLDKVASECLRVLRPGGEIIIANEPVRMRLLYRLSQRARSWLGSLFGKQTGYKHELAEQFQTHVWDLTQTVNYHHESGIDPEPFDDRFERVARIEYGDERLAFIWRKE
jgi:ubiquinone/menaquinone biosynthesis C-methylase UbiE